MRPCCLRACRSKLQELAFDSRVPNVVVQRICLVVASASAMSGGEAAQRLLNHAFDLAASAESQGLGRLSYALTILTSLAEEADGLDRLRRQALMPAMSNNMPRFLSLISSVMGTYGSGACCRRSMNPNSFCIHRRYLRVPMLPELFRALASTRIV